MTKICSICKITKNIAEFHKRKNSKDGYRSRCKECRKQYAIENSEKIKKYQQEYRKLNKEEINRKQREFINNLSDDKREKYKKTKEKWIDDNKEHLKSYKKKWKKDNKIELRNKARKIYHTNINEKIKTNLRNRINKALKNNYKTGSAVKDLGCSIEEFKKYIEERFKPGMSWENHGEWHLDHIKPLANFDLTDREQFLEACHYTNYHPLWAIDNLKKGDR